MQGVWLFFRPVTAKRHHTFGLDIKDWTLTRSSHFHEVYKQDSAYRYTACSDRSICNTDARSCVRRTGESGSAIAIITIHAVAFDPDARHAAQRATRTARNTGISAVGTA